MISDEARGGLVSDRRERGWLQRVASAREILAFPEQLAAEREAVELLLIGQLTRVDAFERGETQGEDDDSALQRSRQGADETRVAGARLAGAAT